MEDDKFITHPLMFKSRNSDLRPGSDRTHLGFDQKKIIGIGKTTETQDLHRETL